MKKYILETTKWNMQDKSSSANDLLTPPKYELWDIS